VGRRVVFGDRSTVKWWLSLAKWRMMATSWNIERDGRVGEETLWVCVSRDGQFDRERENSEQLEKQAALEGEKRMASARKHKESMIRVNPGSLGDPQQYITPTSDLEVQE